MSDKKSAKQRPPLVTVPPTPTCHHCATEMVEGFIVDHGTGINRMVATWVEGHPESTFLGNTVVADKTQYKVRAYRCETCGLLQLFAR